MPDPGNITQRFSIDETLPDDLPQSPFGLFTSWLDLARDRATTPNPNAMTLATVDDEGRPTARVILCKDIQPDPGYIVFHTNRNSPKGKHLADRPDVAAVFHWDALERQARIEGTVIESPDAESDAYFASRPWENRLAAWASDQSQPIASRDELITRVGEAIERLDIDIAALMAGEDVTIPRPPYWGGYRLWARRIELWCGGKGRIHDRAQWTRTLTPSPAGFDPGNWSSTRLQP